MAAVEALAWERALRQLPALVDPEDPEVRRVVIAATRLRRRARGHV